MGYLAKTREEVLQQALRKIETSTPITAIGAGSVARALTEAITTELGDFYNILDFNMTQQVLSTATGRSLDLLGRLYQVERKTLNSLATLDKKLGSFYFYIDSPYTSSITIPAGTKVFTNNQDYVGQLFTYTVTDNVVIATGRTRTWASIRPLFADSIFTAGINTLVTHNFEHPDEDLIIRCSNPKPISASIGFEDDDSYRLRIEKGVRTASGGTSEAIRFAALSIQGVRDVTVRNAPYGLGSAEVIVVPDGAALTVPTVNEVSRQLQTVRPTGVRMFVRQPTALPIDVTASIVLRNEQDIDADKIADRAKITALRYINTMLAGTPFIYNQFIQAIFDASESIMDVSLTTYRFSGEEAQRRNLTPKADEQITPGTISVSATTIGTTVL